MTKLTTKQISAIRCRVHQLKEDGDFSQVLDELIYDTDLAYERREVNFEYLRGLITDCEAELDDLKELEEDHVGIFRTAYRRPRNGTTHP